MIRYVDGDATRPEGEGEAPRFIIHCCNNLGLWGAGFVLALSERWPEPEESYYEMGKRCNGYQLGGIDIVKVEENLWVVNMIGQSGVGPNNGIPPIRYKKLRHALRQVELATRLPRYQGPYKRVSVHAPRFGAGLAGGDWRIIEEIILEELVEKGVSVTIYDYAG